MCFVRDLSATQCPRLDRVHGEPTSSRDSSRHSVFLCFLLYAPFQVCVVQVFHVITFRSFTLLTFLILFIFFLFVFFLFAFNVCLPVLEKDAGGGAAGAEATAANPGDASTTGAVRQLLLTPVGTVVVGVGPAEAFVRSYQARVTADQKVYVSTLAKFCIVLRGMLLRACVFGTTRSEPHGGGGSTCLSTCV